MAGGEKSCVRLFLWVEAAASLASAKSASGRDWTDGCLTQLTRRSLPALRQVMSLQTLSARQLTNTTQYHSPGAANQCCVEQSTHKAHTQWLPA